MKRHIALRSLSSDHHRALVEARRLIRAGEGKDDAGEAVRTYLSFAEGALSRHFREEEEILLPAYAVASGSSDALIQRVLREHVHIRARTLELANAVTQGILPGGELSEIGHALEAHVRFEERELFPAIERGLPGERLAAVGVLLASGLAD